MIRAGRPGGSTHRSSPRWRGTTGSSSTTPGVSATLMCPAGPIRCPVGRGLRRVAAGCGRDLPALRASMGSPPSTSPSSIRSPDPADPGRTVPGATRPSRAARGDRALLGRAQDAGRGLPHGLHVLYAERFRPTIPSSSTRSGLPGPHRSRTRLHRPVPRHAGRRHRRPSREIAVPALVLHGTRRPRPARQRGALTKLIPGARRYCRRSRPPLLPRDPDLTAEVMSPSSAAAEADLRSGG